MAGPSESRRLCSWWWDSHISPKNSKWLQENLTEIDSKVKGMIKIINEDADSFARRAEMYYKKRPELMKLVEEFYRAYRALAERYDNATGELRMAHKTISEVFPNQIPPLLSDDTPSPNPHLVRAFFDPDVLCRDSDSGLSRKGLKQLNEMFQIGEGETESLKEALAKMEAEKDLIVVKYKQSIEELNSVQNEVKTLKETLSMSESEKQEALVSYEQSVEKMFVLEGKLLLAEETAKQLDEEVNIAEDEIKMLNEKLSVLNADKEDSDLLYQQCLESVSVLQNELVEEKDEIRRLKSEILLGSAKLRGVEDVCALFEKMNESLRLEGDDLVQKIAEKDEMLFQKHTELEKLMSRLGDEETRFAQVQETLNSLQSLYCRSQDEQRDLTLELKNGVLMLKNLELEIQHLKEENRGLNELNLASCMAKTDMEHEIMSLKEMKEKFEAEANKQEEQNEHLQRQVHHLKEETENLLKKYHDLLRQVESAGIDPKCASSSIKDLRDKYSRLKETCNSLSKEKLSLVDEKSALFSQLETITDTMKGQLEKNALMENSLLCANVELEGLRVKSKSLEDMCKFLSNEKSNLESDRSRLIENSQVEMFMLQKLIQDMEEKNMMKHVEMEFLVDQVYGHVVKGKEENQQLQIQNTVLSAVIRELKLKGTELEERKRVIDNGFFLLNQNYAVLEHENDQLLELIKCLKNRLSEVEEENHILVEQSSAAIVEALCFSNQSVVYKSLCAEKAMELEMISEEINNLREAYIDSENEAKVLIRRLEEKNQELNVFNHQLNQKSVKLFSAEQRIAALEDVNTELNSTIEGLDVIHGGLEQRITELTQYKQHQEIEIVTLREANERLESDLDVLNEEIEACKIREVILSCELHERGCEFQLWEAEASSFYFDLQSSGIREALYEDKAYELSGLCDDLEDVSSRRCVEIEMMKDRISFLESERDGLKTELSAYVPAIASLKNNIVSLEKNPVLQTKLTSPQQEITVSERSGLSELHDMQSRIETIESAMKEIEEVKSSSTSNEVTGAEFVNGTRMKDIPLDYISEVPSYSNRRKGSDKLDKMLELWETDEVGPTEIDKNVIELNTMIKRKVILERLCSDAQKLERVRVTVEELKRKIEGEKEAEYERVRSQVQDIEDSAVQFAGLNAELKRAIRESDEVIEVEEARKEGEKIGRLEVDVKKVQKMLIKLEGEKGSKKKKTKGWEKGLSKRSIVVRELFVGSGRKRIGKKKVRFCGCMP